MTDSFRTSSEKVVALTGANGFLGKALRMRLERNFKVLSLVRNPADPALAFELPHKVPSAAALKSNGVTHLVHCAFDFSPLTGAEHQRVNITPYRTLLDSAENAGVRNMLLISSLSAFEGTRSLYGKTKLEMERMTSARGGMSLRPGLIHSDSNGSLVGNMVRALQASRFVPVVGDGQSIQYATHLDDLTSVVEDHFVKHFTRASSVLYAAHPRAFPYEDLLNLIAARLQLAPRRFIHLPWRVVWAGLALMERLGMRAPFRSDSVVGLVHGNPEPVKLVPEFEGRFREF